MIRFVVVLAEPAFNALTHLADRERVDVRAAAAQLIEDGLRHAGLGTKMTAPGGGGAAGDRVDNAVAAASVAQTHAGATRRPEKANRAVGRGSIQVSSRTGDEIALIIGAIAAPSTDGGDDARA